MRRDDDFTLKIGKTRSRGDEADKRSLDGVVREARRAGARAGKHRGFVGTRIGRGAGIGAVLSARDRWAGYRGRRVVIKTRLVKLARRGLDGARLHLRYIQRDGVTRDGLPGELYDARHDRADGTGFLDRSAGDRHQFRFIVAPEDGSEYPDLMEVTRRLMRQMERDLGTRLDWVAVDHFNTGHPHTHVVLRGRDETGNDLIIARDYIAHGMRERAAEIVTLDLGPRTDREIERRLRNEIEQERFTSIDRTLVRDANDDGIVSAGGAARDSHARLRQALRAGRLQKLGRLGLAEEISTGLWRLRPDLEPTLRRMGERGDIIKTLHQALAKERIDRGGADFAIFDASDGRPQRLVGRVVGRGLSDELNDRHYLIVDGVDGRTHYVDIGKGDATEPIPTGAIVAIEAKRVGVRTSDRTIAEVAAANANRYTIDIHLQYDRAATDVYAEAHVRRLEALRRAGFVERQPDGTWVVPEDFLDRAAAYEAQVKRAVPVRLEVLSPLPLERQVHAQAATWLDRELTSGESVPIRDSGFGREVRLALSQRQQWLVEQGLAEQEAGEVLVKRNLLAVLRRRELLAVGRQLSDELGLHFAEPPARGRVEGIYRRRVDLASGRYALIEKSREFTLVPWRPVLERGAGKVVSGIVRGGEISWTIGRQRSGPSL